RPGISYHAEKQSVRGIFYLGDIMLEEIRAGLRDLGLADDTQALLRFVNAMKYALNKLKDDPGYAEKVKSLMSRAPAMQEHKNASFSRMARSGAFDKIKQRGFYVDVDESHTVVSDPSTIDETTADEWIGHARSWLSRICDDESAEKAALQA